jgi:hypothetical protein
MTNEQLEELEHLVSSASKSPWYVSEMDDEACMGAVAVTTTLQTTGARSMRAGTWPSEDVVAACLVQSPPYATISDDKFIENAQLIAFMRNHIEDLIAIAKKYNALGLT